MCAQTSQAFRLGERELESRFAFSGVFGEGARQDEVPAADRARRASCWLTSVSAGLCAVDAHSRAVAVRGQELAAVCLRDHKQRCVRALPNGLCANVLNARLDAGKTFTIQGNAEQPGILPQALRTIFRTLDAQQAAPGPASSACCAFGAVVVPLTERGCSAGLEAAAGSVCVVLRNLQRAGV
jgi:hypothetical protein